MTFNLRLIPLLPFLGAAILMLFGRKWSRDTVVAVAAGAIAGSCLVAADAFFSALPLAAPNGGLHDTVGTWISAGPLKIDLAFRLDGLSGLLCLIITFIGFLIHIYSSGYMEHDPDYPRFFAYLNLFCGAMLVLVLGDSLPVMFIGWEGVGLCSYLLIGFWYKETANANAGKKAFIVNRIGDFGFLIGMFLLFQYTGTLNFQEITANANATVPGSGAGLMTILFPGTIFAAPVAFWAALFLFVGATGKSAQIPLYVWLPDAMAGPTPVSALIHAATMVTAGVYMVARMHAVYLLSPGALAIVTSVGALTALFAAIIGFAQNDFKKVLAYSTVSQLGFMFVGVGTGNFEGGIFHLYTHAFFKAGLFLCAGSVMHAMSGSGDITTMGGLRKKLPWTHGVFVVCWLAICGVVFSGFLSKDSIIAGAMSAEERDEGVRLGRAGRRVSCSASPRWGPPSTCRGSTSWSSPVSRAPPTRSSTTSTSRRAAWSGPLVVLAIGAALGGLIGLPGGLFEHADWNLLDRELSPVLGAEVEVSHMTEIARHGRRHRAGAAGHRPRLALLRRRLPRAVAQVRGRRPQAGQAGAGQVPHRRALPVPDRPSDPEGRPGDLLRGRPNLDRQDPGRRAGGGGRLLRAPLAQRAGERRRAALHGGVRARRRGARLPQHPPDGARRPQGDGERDGGRRRRPARQQAERRGARVQLRLRRRRKPEASGAGPVAHHTYARPGDYTIRVDVKDKHWNTSSSVKQKVTVR